MNLTNLFTTLKILTISLAILISGNVCKAQKISEQEKAALITFCDKYLQVQKSFDADSLDDVFRDLVSDTLYAYFDVRREYFKLEDFKLWYLPIKAAVAKRLDNHFQCEMHNSDTLVYSLDVRKKQSGYEVFAFNDKPFKQEYYDFYAHLVDSIKTAHQFHAEIDSAAAKFLRAYLHFTHTGDISKMTPLSVGINFDLVILRRQLDSLGEWNYKRRFSIREFGNTHLTSDSTATCKIYTTSGSAKFKLIKQNGTWLVTYENDLTLGYKSKQELLAEIAHLKHLSDIETAIEVFDSVTLQFLQEGDVEKLRNETSAQVSQLMSLFRKQIGAFKGKHLRMHGLRFNARYSDIEFDVSNTEAIFTSDDIDVHLAKTDSWRVVAINRNEFRNTVEWMYNHFHDYVRLFGTYLYPYDDEDNDEMEVFSVLAEGQEDSSVLDQLTRFKVRPTSTVGNNLLFQRIDSLAGNFMLQNPELKAGIVYLDFIVEKNGLYSDVKVASTTNEVLNAYAMHILNDLPKWAPAIYFKDFTRSRFVLPIKFDRN